MKNDTFKILCSFIARKRIDLNVYWQLVFLILFLFFQCLSFFSIDFIRDLSHYLFDTLLTQDCLKLIKMFYSIMSLIIVSVVYYLLLLCLSTINYTYTMDFVLYLSCCLSLCLFPSSSSVFWKIISNFFDFFVFLINLKNNFAGKL